MNGNPLLSYEAVSNPVGYEIDYHKWVRFGDLVEWLYRFYGLKMDLDLFSEDDQDWIIDGIGADI